MSKIIDVSRYQGDIDFNAVKSAGISGVIIKAGGTGWGDENACYTDDNFEKNYAACKAAGLQVGAYYYGAVDSVDGAIREATYFLKLLSGKQFELPVYYDVEESHRFGPLSKDAVTDIVMTFCCTVESAGYWTGVYANLYYLRNKLDYDRIKRFTLWLAQDNDNPTYENPFEMWQFTSSGSVPGINGNVDMDECYKDFETSIKSSHVNGWAPAPAAKPDGWDQRGPKPSLIWDNEYDSMIADLQRILNAKGSSLPIDGIAGDSTYYAVKGYTINKGDAGPLTKWVQQRLTYEGCGCTIDGTAGDGTMSAIKGFQQFYQLGVGYLGGTDWYYLIR